MQLESLTVLCEVARQGSITAAARRLRFTQSAVSRQIAVLEAELGVRLFDRLPRGVAPTESGRCLLAHAEAVLGRLDDARRELTALSELGAGRLRVGAFPTANTVLVPQALASFRSRHPDVAMSLVEGTTPQLLERLAEGTVDVAVVSEHPARPFATEQFRLRHLLDEPMLVAVGRGHRLARRSAADARTARTTKPTRPTKATTTARTAARTTARAARAALRTVRLAELASEPWVAGTRNVPETLLARFPLGFAPTIEFVAAEWIAKLGFAAAGVAVTLVPALAARAAPPDVVLLRLRTDEAPPRRIYAATLAGRSEPASVSAFGKTLRDTARQILPR